jgi:hypothetical protein
LQARLQIINSLDITGVVELLAFLLRLEHLTSSLEVRKSRSSVRVIRVAVRVKA